MDLAPGPLLPRAVALALATALAAAPCTHAAESPAGEAAHCGAALGVDLYRLFGARAGNVIFSPYSITEAVALLSAGADGETRQELLHALHWSGPADPMAAAFGAQDQELGQASRADAVLSVANGVWYQRGHEPLAAYLETARVAYRADVRIADFSANLLVSQHMINNWVREKTAGKITDLMPPGSITTRTQMVLANAIYFKGAWQLPFSAGRTMGRPFFTAPGQSAATPTMEQTAAFRTAAADGCGLLELPYAGGRLSMVVVLPNARDGLPALEQGLAVEGLSRWLAALDRAAPGEVAVSLPLFKLTFMAELGAALQKLGVATAFREHEADFSRIDGRRDLFLSAVLHKAFVDVNEVGTEAGAATGMTMTASAVQQSRVFFTVDHPFLFLIRDASTGAVLFLGRVADPRAP